MQSPILNVPLEIIVKIIVIGCQPEIKLAGHLELQYKPVGIAYRKTIYPFAKLVSQVCKEWYDLVHSTTNSQFYVTGLPLILDEENDNVEIQLASFREALLLSGNCDLEVVWRIERPLIDDPGYMILIRLMMHGLLMLEDHMSQVVYLGTQVASSRDLTLLFSLLINAGRLTRLYWLSITNTPSPSPKALPINLNGCFDMTVGWLPGPDEKEASKRLLASPVHLDLHGIDLWDHVSLPESLRSLQITFSSSNNHWIDFQTTIELIRELKSLKVLTLDLHYRRAVPRQPPKKHRRALLPKLSIMRLYGYISTLLAFLVALELPGLESLSLDANTDQQISYHEMVEHVEQRRISISDSPFLPSLNALHLHCDSRSSRFLLTLLSSEGLRDVSIRTEGYEQVMGGGGPQQMTLRCVLAPYKIRFQGLSLLAIKSLLHQMDLQMLHSLVLQDLNIDGDLSFSEAESPGDNSRQICVPALQELYLVSCTPSQIASLGRLLEASHPHKLTIKSWLCFDSLSSPNGLRNTTFFLHTTWVRTDLPPYHAALAHPLSYCPNLTFLELELSQDWSCLKWLIVAREVGEHDYEGEEVLLKELRRLKLYMDAEAVYYSTAQVRRWLNRIRESRRDRNLPILEMEEAYNTEPVDQKGVFTKCL